MARYKPFKKWEKADTDFYWLFVNGNLKVAASLLLVVSIGGTYSGWPLRSLLNAFLMVAGAVFIGPLLLILSLFLFDFLRKNIRSGSEE